MVEGSRSASALTAIGSPSCRLPDGRHLAIAVFVSDSKADEATREAVIAKISRAAWDYFVEAKR
jgi:hypothetical protein